VIDGLDECDESKKGFLTFLRRLQQDTPFVVRILITSCNGLDIGTSPTSWVSSVTIPFDVSEDIIRFVEDQLEIMPALHGNSALKSTLTARLVKSPSNFLWVSTMISRMKEVWCAEKLLGCLIGVPGELDTMYDCMLSELRQIDVQSEVTIFEILSWITTSSQSLSLTQLSEAVSFSAPQRLNERDVNLLIHKSCSNILFLWPSGSDDPYVTVCHMTLIDFLERRQLSQYFPYLESQVSVRSKIGRLCIQRIIDEAKSGPLCSQQEETQSRNPPSLLE